ncbi:MAG: hypothetical protein KAU21_04185 [Gammaproteobacteria bacterium]|nr:hypothetical protein [Gammaproteobacteria bacterium]
MSKKKAFLIHLAASLLVFSILLMLIIYVWYPAPYFDVDYRMKWISMIAFIDIVLGPGLTLLVYRADKPSIRFDMTVIVIVQVTALSWGVWNAWSAHPKTNIFFDSQLYCLDRNEIKSIGVAPAIVTNSMTDKIMLMLPYPETKEQKREYLDHFVAGKPLVFEMAYLYEVASKEMTAKLGENQPDIMSIVNSNDDYMKQWQQFISNYEGVNKDWRYYGFHCFEEDQVAVLDRKNNKIEAILKMKLPGYWNF